MSKTFINRKSEIDFFDSDISFERDKTKVVLLVAPHGIGKSKLTEFICESIDSHIGIEIRPPLHSSKYEEDSYYLRLLGRNLHAKSVSTGKFLDFNSFLRGWKSPRLRKVFAHDLASSASQLSKVGGVAYSTYERTFGSGDFDSDEVFKSNMSSSIVAIEEYIRHIVSQFPILVCIENAQNFDHYSLEFLKEIAEGPSKLYAILEYTKNDTEGWSIDSIASYLNNEKIDFQIRKLEKMKVREALQILRQKPGAIEAFVEQAYIESDGNLRPLADVNVQFEVNSQYLENYIGSGVGKTLRSITQLNLQTLSNSDQFVLSLIVTHGGSVEAEYLQGVYGFQNNVYAILDLQANIENLILRELILREGLLLKTAHDELLQEVRTMASFHRYNLASYRYWQHFYEKCLSDQGNIFISRAEALIMVLVCHHQLEEDEKMLGILEEIGRSAIQSRSPARLINYVEMARKKLILKSENNDVNLKLNFSFVDLFYYSGLFSHALKALDDIESDSYRCMAYRALLLDASYEHEAAIELATEYQEKVKHSLTPSFELTLHLVKLSALRSLNRHDECRELFLSLTESSVYKNCFEYGYLLRCAELALPAMQAIPYMRESIEFFKEIGAESQEARARIALTLELGDLGDLDGAELELDSAEKLLADSISERHTLLNNRAAIMMFRGNFNQEVEELLRIARITGESEFEKIIILNNQLVLYSNLEDQERAEHIIQIIESILLGPYPRDLEIRRIALFNISVHYHKWRNPQLEEYYTSRAKNINLSYNEDYWLARFKGETTSENENYSFRLKFPFNPAFLSYWTLDVGEHLDY